MARRLALACVGVAVAACASGAPARPGLTVYAAASLQPVLEDVASQYERLDGRPDLVLVTGSSAALRAQIEAGAPADVFLSADESNPNALATAGLTHGPPVAFAGNTLAIIVPATNPAAIGSPVDLARPGVKVVATDDSVPIGRYAARLVASLAALPGYPADFAAKYAANVVSREDNVSAAAAKVALAEADAAIVYRTDALTSDGVTPIPMPRGIDVTARYAGVVLGRSSAAAHARQFLAWLAGPDGRRSLESWGFGPPP